MSVCLSVIPSPSPSAELNVTPSKPSREVGQRSFRRLGELRDINK